MSNVNGERIRVMSTRASYDALPAIFRAPGYLSTDLLLDTLPYNAGTTASDALWMGVPGLPPDHIDAADA
jgi:predicted O-linked N-acetylglucosamine transferase (SPINDLY family)